MPSKRRKRRGVRIEARCTLADHFVYMLGTPLRESAAPHWPPDLFGLVASSLHDSGAYCRVVQSWPPSSSPTRSSWVDMVRASGLKWREAWRASGPSQIPGDGKKWWKTVVAESTTPLSQLSENRPLCEALLQLLALADEAS